MADTVNVNFKLDGDIKKSMEAACADMGLTMSAAFTLFARAVAAERAIPFKIVATTPNKETIAAMDEAEKLAHDPSAKRYSSFSEILEEVKADV